MASSAANGADTSPFPPPDALERAVLVTGLAPGTSEATLRDFFSFCGKLVALRTRDVPGGADAPDVPSSMEAVLVFDTPTARQTALLLHDSALADVRVCITPAAAGWSATPPVPPAAAAAASPAAAAATAAAPGGGAAAGGADAAAPPNAAAAAAAAASAAAAALPNPEAIRAFFARVTAEAARAAGALERNPVVTSVRAQAADVDAAYHLSARVAAAGALARTATAELTSGVVAAATTVDETYGVRRGVATGVETVGGVVGGVRDEAMRNENVRAAVGAVGGGVEAALGMGRAAVGAAWKGGEDLVRSFGPVVEHVAGVPPAGGGGAGAPPAGPTPPPTTTTPTTEL
ncbi:hypothetical protein BU14_0077s0004 [Porphyra umbilicalis]|uniref:RRM domain-containing protein n=1 Tax=Porphyra umbilicalis TaxID=2786 RepID=A0A1X6PEV0_PORUM|nr:hypothetical protein BU14_0077s0004 [Porphyra umbilicalis]|eukprot:OSX79384.1 hypothetical protein BU14_0077s0004 [Porphyra umbilicalis]